MLWVVVVAVAAVGVRCWLDVVCCLLLFVSCWCFCVGLLPVSVFLCRLLSVFVVGCCWLLWVLDVVVVVGCFFVGCCFCCCDGLLLLWLWLSLSLSC